jgi:uncharacterized protein (TIGR02996 family)
MTLTSPAAVGLFRAIVEDPSDDVPRLLLADVLEEAGEGERAEFIRVQCELAKFAPRLAARLYHEQQKRQGKACDVLGCHWCFLRRRERELFAEAYPALTSGLPGEPVDYLVEGLSCRRRFGDRTAIFTFRRGFVASGNLACADWCGAECPCYWTEQNSDGTCSRCHGAKRTGGHGPALVLAAPIEDVTLKDVSFPYPEPIATFMDQSAHGGLIYASEQVPRVVSRAALAWARHEAGLPALTF